MFICFYFALILTHSFSAYAVYGFHFILFFEFFLLPCTKIDKHTRSSVGGGGSSSSRTSSHHCIAKAFSFSVLVFVCSASLESIKLWKGWSEYAYDDVHCASVIGGYCVWENWANVSDGRYTSVLLKMILLLRLYAAHVKPHIQRYYCLF